MSAGSPATPPPSAPAVIRPATADDLPHIRDLLSQRDARPWDDASTAWFVMDLDPERCLTWIAFVGDRPVGLSMMYLRDLRGPSRTHRVGYWANLYIDPGFRDRMLYPRLPLLMFQAAPVHGLEFIYSSVRLRDLADAHTRIGFAKIGGMPVLAKPLRPARLLGKYRRWPALALASPPLDAAFRMALRASWSRAPRDLGVEPVDPASAEMDEIAELVRALSRDRIANAWSVEFFRYRYLQTREGGSYRVLAARRDRRLAGALIFRVAERGEGIRAAVIMDLICAPGEAPAMTAALARAEREAHAAGCDVAMFLSGLGPEIAAALTSFGYRRTHEVYELMAWPKRLLADEPDFARLDRWSYAFRDHDAF